MNFLNLMRTAPAGAKIRFLIRPEFNDRIDQTMETLETQYYISIDL